MWKVMAVLAAIVGVPAGAATVVFSNEDMSLTFKVNDPDAEPDFGGPYDGVTLLEDGPSVVTAVIDGVTYQDTGPGTFELVQYPYGAYAQPYPFDFGIEFAGDTIAISAWIGYDATRGWVCCDYGYFYTTPSSIDFTVNGAEYVLDGEVTISAVPLPSSGLMLLTGLGLVALRRHGYAALFAASSAISA